MLVVQLLRGAVKHAGSRPHCSVKQLISAIRGISSSPQQLCAFGRTHPSSCTETDHPKVLITGWFMVFSFLIFWISSSNVLFIVSSKTLSQWYLISTNLSLFFNRRAWTAGGGDRPFAEVRSSHNLLFQLLIYFQRWHSSCSSVANFSRWRVTASATSTCWSKTV